MSTTGSQPSLRLTMQASLCENSFKSIDLAYILSNEIAIVMVVFVIECPIPLKMTKVS